MLKEGSTIKGSWNQNSYQIRSLLGKGSFGQVYLTNNRSGKEIAIKISKNAQSIQNEYKILKKLNRNVSFKKLKALPHVYETDDITFNDKLFRYFTLDVINGISLSHVVNEETKTNNEVKRRILLQLANIISCIHEENMALGDLKPSNMIYDFANNKLTLIDLGGVTPFGKEIQEFTPLYDRVTWGKGSRISSPSYDIFSFGILCYYLYTADRLIDPEKGIAKILDNLPASEISEVIVGSLTEKFTSMTEIIYILNSFVENLGRKKLVN